VTRITARQRDARSGRVALALCSPEKGHTQMKWTSIAAATLCALLTNSCLRDIPSNASWPFLRRAHRPPTRLKKS